jgi:hypothetical protein
LVCNFSKTTVSGFGRSGSISKYLPGSLLLKKIHAPKLSIDFTESDLNTEELKSLLTQLSK